MRALQAAEVFDGSAFLGPATVLVDGETIVGVENGHHDPPDGAEVTTYDGTLLPGLFDCHVHLVASSTVGSLERAGGFSDDELDAVIRDSLTAQVAGGVTTVVDLGDVRYRSLGLRAEPGLPRVLAAGPPITVDGGHCHYLGGVVASGVEHIRAAVAEHADRGVDLIKVMASGGMVTEGTDVMGVQFTSEELAAAVEAGHDRGLRVVAHAHSLAGARHAVRAGADGIEHFTCLTDDGSVTPDDLLDELVAAGTVIDPTVGIDLARVPPSDKLPPVLRATMERLGVDFDSLPRIRAAQLARVRDRGLTVVTGTDAGIAPTKAHGGSWRAVVDLLDAGYSMASALATATSGAADVFGLGETTGRLKPGLAADLLVVDGDPTRQPQALGSVVTVLVRGTPAAQA